MVTVVLCILAVARLIVKIGNGSFFLELLHVYAVFTCLLMPLLGYVYFNSTSKLAVLWVRSMPVPQDQYFLFAIPAIIVTGWGFFLFRSKKSDDKEVVNYLTFQLRKDILQIKPVSILTLVFVSLIAYNIGNFLPDSLKQVNSFLYYSLFAGIFYIVFYKDFPGKMYLIVSFVVFIGLDAVRSSMFTIIAYMGGLFLILLLAGRQIYFYQKIGLLLFSIFFIAFIQLFKLDLRQSRRIGKESSAMEAVARVIGNASNSTNFEDIVFPLYYRMNQGYNIGLVMRRIPSKVDYLGGTYLELGFVSSFVPRLFWPDKPKAGGEENMRIYTGYIIKDWSTNVGPLGEAYGNFGNWGGWLYLFVFAFFIRWVYMKFMNICMNRPILFLWMPALFFQTFYVMETDSLQAFNSLIKGAIFLFLLYKLFPFLFPAKTK